MGFRGGNGPFGAHLPPRLRLGGKYGPLRPISHPQTMENREFTARIHCFTTITRTKYHLSCCHTSFDFFESERVSSLVYKPLTVDDVESLGFALISFSCLK